jgi:hypothetical protein
MYYIVDWKRARTVLGVNASVSGRDYYILGPANDRATELSMLGAYRSRVEACRAEARMPRCKFLPFEPTAEKLREVGSLKAAHKSLNAFIAHQHKVVAAKLRKK